MNSLWDMSMISFSKVFVCKLKDMPINSVNENFVDSKVCL